MMTGLGSLSATSEKDAGPMRTLGLWLAVIAVAAGGGLRAAGAVLNRGIYWPDEIYQTLEPAHWLVFGYGLHPWEYIQGARGWVLPGAIAGIFKASQLVGLGQADAYLAIVRTVFALVGVLTVLATYQLARRLGASTLAAAIGTAVCALWAPMVYFAARAMAEMASALPVIVGLSLALPEDATRRSRIFGTDLLGGAVLLRHFSAWRCCLFGLPAGTSGPPSMSRWCCWSRRWSWALSTVTPGGAGSNRHSCICASASRAARRPGAAGRSVTISPPLWDCPAWAPF